MRALTNKPYKFLSVVFFAVVMVGCTGLPKGIEPVREFELERYQGLWYEIARLDHRFERGLSRVTAEYSIARPGRVEVRNRGYNASDAEWKDIVGKAKFKSAPDVGHLLVSFFGPIYGSYVVFQLDDYRHAFVAGNSRKYLWFLSRTPNVSDAEKKAFVDRAEALGFSSNKLVWVDHSAIE